MPNRLEERASKNMAAAKTAKAGAGGVFGKLIQEHEEAAALLRRLRTSTTAGERQRLYAEVRQQLLAHERGELAEVYPVFVRYEATRQIAAAHDANARQIEAAIRALDAAGADGTAWEPALARLVTMVEHHVDEEEREYFPVAQSVLGDELSQALLERYQARKQTELQLIAKESRPH